VFENIFLYDFIRNALIGGIMIGILTPIVGVFVIMRRLSFIADGIGHINMSGLAFGYFLASFGILTSLTPFF